MKTEVKRRTNWSSPCLNIFAALNALRKALAYGQKARIIRMYNEECDSPIYEEVKHEDFRDFEFSVGLMTNIDAVKANKYYTEFEKYLTLNYRACFGTPEAVENYYKTGVLTKDNIMSGGRSHLVKAVDLHMYYEDHGDVERAKNTLQQYITGEIAHENHWWDFFRLKSNLSYRKPKHFRRKLWVVELLDETAKTPSTPWLVYLLDWLAVPLKYIPRRSVLRMPTYTNYNFRVGGVTNGYDIQFQIPKKFSFRD